MTQQQNLKVSYDFIRFIQGQNRCVMAHLYKFVSQAGAVDYFTDLDTDVIWSNQTWKSGSLRIEGLKRKVGIGLSVDEQSVKIWAAPTDTLWGGNFLTNAQQGALDGALITRYRAVWNLTTGIAANDVAAGPMAVWVMQTGYMSTIDKGGVSHIELKIKSPLVKLDVNMPRNYYEPGCNWTLFDAGCTLLKASFTVNGTIGPAPSLSILPIVGGLTQFGADGLGNYVQGRILFTSGANSGFLTLINNNDASNLQLAYPLENPVVAGDTVQFWPGCSKSFNTCKLKFANDPNFRGFDKVPPVVVST